MSAEPSTQRRTRIPRPYTTSATRECQHCFRQFNAKGHASHEKACGLATAAAERDKVYETRLEDEVRLSKRARLEENTIANVVDNEGNDVELEIGNAYDERSGTGLDSGGVASTGSPFVGIAAMDDDSHPDIQVSSESTDGEANLQSTTLNSVNLRDETDEELALELDDIKIQYHPASKRNPVIAHFQDFSRSRTALNIPPAEAPFRPFYCQNDFAFARVAMDAALKPDHINALVKLIRSVAAGAEFTLTGHRDLMDTWKKASDILTPFQDIDIEVPYLKETKKYKVWLRPLWDWTLDLLRDARLLPHFTWNAERLYKFDGDNFERFIDEPWTADRFWQIQSALPPNSYPICWILYADKNKMSSFGTVKGYPVIVRCANLPIAIRNGNGIGGGRVVGWLPVVKDDAEYKDKDTFRNHKRVVWHEALREMLRSIESYSKEGYCFVGADGVERKVFPCIFALSADYEEQTFMTAIRGLRGLAPCPVCLVHVNNLADLSIEAELRTAKNSEKSFLKVQNETLEEVEKELKPKGLRRVFNTFWRLDNSDPHRAVSWDRLHGYSIGIFGDHLWKNFKQCFMDLGRSARVKVDKQFSLIPRFRNMHHFSAVVHIYFNDGSKFEDMAKQLLFAAHNVLTREKSKHGYLLLQCLRSFLTLDTLLSFEVHTEGTIRMGERELQNFSRLIKNYVEALPAATEKKKEYTINWSFIKMHFQVHAFDDVRSKGATRNYNTKPNEKLHKPMRDAYHRRTNFKEVEKQILNVDHYLLVSNFIQSKIDDLEKHNALQSKQSASEEDDILEVQLESDEDHKYSLGSAQKKVAISKFEADHSHDAAFRNFRTKLANHLTTFLQAHSIALPNGKRVRITPEDTITEYRFIKVNYENMVTWKESTDYLRCTPKFFGNPRYDAVIVQTVNGLIFAHLICIVNYRLEGKSYPTALIQPCDAPTGRLRRKDLDLGFTRVRCKPRDSPEFISIHTIIRGAVLVPAFDKEGDYLVMDVLDADMFVRMRKMQYFWY